MLVSAGLGRTGLVLIWEGDSWQPGQRDKVDDALQMLELRGREAGTGVSWYFCCICLLMVRG